MELSCEVVGMSIRSDMKNAVKVFQKISSS